MGWFALTLSVFALVFTLLFVRTAYRPEYAHRGTQMLRYAAGWGVGTCVLGGISAIYFFLSAVGAHLT